MYDGMYLAGMSWFQREPVLTSCVQAHWAANPSYRGVWLNRRIVNHMFDIYLYADVDAIVAQVEDEYTCRLLVKLGFKRDGQWMYKLRKDHDGWYSKASGQSTDRRSYRRS